MTSKKQTSYLLFAIFSIALAAFFRFWGFSEWSLHNDELSTLFRASYPTVNEVIEKGVKTDVHPGFSEILAHFWTKYFGNSPFSLRFPYLLSSITGVYFFYLLAKLWVEQKAAVLATSLISVSYLFVLYSQIARPYALGFLLIVGFSYYWYRWWLKSKDYKSVIGSFLFGTISLYTHYFLGLSIILVISTSLFFITKNKKDWLFLFLVPLAMGISFLPHLSITLSHLSQKGVGWLPMPQDDFLLDFMFFSFNQNWIWISIVFLLPILLLLIKRKESSFKARHLLLLFLFISPYAIGHYYSIKVSPVLQYSVLIFALPFLVLFVYSFVPKNLSKNWFLASYLIMILGGSVSLIYGTEIYERKPFADFKSVTEDLAKWNKSYSDEIAFIGNTNNPDYFVYYFDLNKNGRPNFKISQFASSEDYLKAQEILDNPKIKYVALGFANVAIPMEIHELMRTQFPEVVEKSTFFNSEAVLYKRSGLERKLISQSSYDKDNAEKWNIKKENFQDSVYFSAPNAYYLHNEEVYALTYKGLIKDLFPTEKAEYLSISAKVMKLEDLKNAQIVVSVEREKEKVYWASKQLNLFGRNQKWSSLNFVIEKKETFLPNDKIGIYFWNPNGSSLIIDDLELNVFEDSDYHYYDF